MNPEYKKARDEASKSIDESRDDLSCHTCFQDGADWGYAYALKSKEVVEMRKVLNFHSKVWGEECSCGSFVDDYGQEETCLRCLTDSALEKFDKLTKEIEK